MTLDLIIKLLMVCRQTGNDVARNFKDMDKEDPNNPVWKRLYLTQQAIQDRIDIAIDMLEDLYDIEELEDLGYDPYKYISIAYHRNKDLILPPPDYLDIKRVSDTVQYLSDLKTDMEKQLEKNQKLLAGVVTNTDIILRKISNRPLF